MGLTIFSRMFLTFSLNVKKVLQKEKKNFGLRIKKVDATSRLPQRSPILAFQNILQNIVSPT